MKNNNQKKPIPQQSLNSSEQHEINQLHKRLKKNLNKRSELFQNSKDNTENLVYLYW